ncbi:tetratricopeptide repeat protein [Geobacter pelophilus]|uniref:Tetratricopeptide repeat protein n=1 Tax=Geoanaerobacter pelophilus TaxID=60036 RepID=A0AAW4LBQ9_9BACT|nr:tetratricopeptide repeat protein [Geoanaerobacter pelophilus]MBT0666533.1 tetratricopeptide repeat protein [Geoanaerobacter pelophilus]
MSLKKHPAMGVACAAVIITLLVYLRALSCDFVNWDDPDYVLNNELIRSLNWQFLVTIFTSIPYDFYIPLTTLSLAIDYHFWGMNPLGYHLTNILFHGANAGLLVLLAARLLAFTPFSESVPVRSKLYTATLLLAGLLFALHPLRVESVAWVTERKDVLNGFFVLLALLSYAGYSRKRLAGEGFWCREYVLTFVFFACSLMAKPSSIVVPLLLLLLDRYPLGRMTRTALPALLLEKVPFFLCAAATVPATMVRFAELDTFHSPGFFPLWIRVIVTGNALFEYFRLTFFPVGILPYYDLPLAIPRIFIVKTAAVLLFLAGATYWGRRQRWVPLALWSFIISLVPVLPFLGNGASIALAARYTYLPSLIPAILIAGQFATYVAKAWADGRQLAARLVCGGTLLVLLAYGGVTLQLIGVWQNAGAMWSRVIASHPFDRAYFYRGLFHVETGDYAAAVADYTACLDLFAQESRPEVYNLYAFRGEALALAGRYGEAVADFDRAIALFPHRLYYYQRGMALRKLGRLTEAERDLQRAGRASGQMTWFPAGTPLE